MNDQRSPNERATGADGERPVVQQAQAPHGSSSTQAVLGALLKLAANMLPQPFVSDGPALAFDFDDPPGANKRQRPSNNEVWRTSMPLLRRQHPNLITNACWAPANRQRRPCSSLATTCHIQTPRCRSGPCVELLDRTRATDAASRLSTSSCRFAGSGVPGGRTAMAGRCWQAGV